MKKGVSRGRHWEERGSGGCCGGGGRERGEWGFCGVEMGPGEELGRLRGGGKGTNRVARRKKGHLGLKGGVEGGNRGL